MSPSSFEPVFIQSTLTSSPLSTVPLQSVNYMKSEEQQNEKPIDLINYYYYSGTSSSGAEKPTKLRKEDRMTERQRLNSLGCSSRLERAKEIARKSHLLASSSSLKSVGSGSSTKDHDNLIDVTENPAVLSNIRSLYHENLTTGNVINKDEDSSTFPPISSTSSSPLLSNPYFSHLLQQHQLYSFQQYLQSHITAFNHLQSDDLLNNLLPFCLNYLTPVNSIQYIQQLSLLHQNSINNNDNNFNLIDFCQNQTPKANKKSSFIYLNPSEQQFANRDPYIQSNNNHYFLKNNDDNLYKNSVSTYLNATKSLNYENDQVNEHFKRSLGTYYESMMDKIEFSHEFNNNTSNKNNSNTKTHIVTTNTINNPNDSNLKLKHNNNDIRKIDVDDHFAKALGDETWKKLKTTNYNTENSFDYEYGLIKKVPQTLS